MAPEVLQPGNGYNFKADIWSFGITALELAHGHAPFSKFPPMKVLLMTIQNAPPGLDYDRDKKFSKSFKEMVAMCLVKDPSKRPSADKLLKHSFFKHAKTPELCVKKLSADLPPLWNRVKAIQLKDAAQLAMKLMPSAEEEAMSQSEYQRGVSAWNFDLEDLKAQAALVRDDDDITETRVKDESIQINNNAAIEHQTNFGKASSSNKISQAELKGHSSPVDEPQADFYNRKGKGLESDLQEPISEDKNGWKKTGSSTDLSASTTENDMAHTKPKPVNYRKTQSGPLIPGVVFSHSRTTERSDIEIQPTTDKARGSPNLSGPLMLPTRASANSLSAPIKSSGGFRDSLDDKTKANLVQIRGRFSVTSENLDLEKGSTLRKSASVDRIFDSKPVPPNISPKEIGVVNAPASHLTPQLHNLLQQTALQQDLIMNLLSSLQSAEAVEATQNGKLPTLPENNGRDEIEATERERLLLLKISELQARMASLNDELRTEKLKYVQLQQQVNSITSRESSGDRRVGNA
jgi:serine/threonine protein kinase